MPIRMIATDIDLTLLDDRGQLPPTNIEALALAARQGIRVVLATARRREAAQEIAQRLHIPTALVCHNGARVWDERGREIAHHTIDLELAQRIAAMADKRSLPIVFTIDETNFVTAQAANLVGSRTVSTPVSSLELIVRLAPTRILCHGELATRAVDEMVGRNSQLKQFRYLRSSGEVYSTVISHNDATKERALEHLCTTWGIQQSEVLAIGDADADVGMLRWAGVGVSLTGSMQQAIEAADWVAPSARFGGVAVAVHRYVLQHQNVRS
ncbi:HAD family hydrolase [Herpetosiphon geysericola]|uniref:Haloacid dehalogenase n=1 Tax=Herpetosiphon geysericola TaxID=70996 RepID=A0A0P6YKG7_9CHLR|nr:HAD family hydrolase [Herpetosiphon geysericola]KPL91127.1 hypothetical protein SE18_02970 [Herpetosiphon geysericola]